MKGRPVALASISCVVVFLLTAYWWRTTSDDNGAHRSISTLLAPLSSLSTAPAYTFAGRDRVAVIIETRPLRTLIPLILHFASVLGPEWPILFFTRAPAIRALEAFGGGSQPFKRMVKSGQVKIIELPSDSYLKNYLGISHFLASRWFWDQMGPAEHMLLFQTDSILCANSERRVEDFFEYDFVGAAHPYTREAFNGGLSLRNVSLSRHIVTTYDILDDIGKGSDFGLFEDVWFWDKMKKLGARFPTRERASEFVVDYEWGERPMGYHGINKGAHEDRLKEIYSWCPEAVLGATWEIVNLTESEQKQNTSSTVMEVETPGGKLLSFG
jgi:hypothetical protein